MITTKKRLPGSVIVQQTAIEQVTNLLEQLPEKPKEVWSLREAIDLLQEPITTALNRGYSHEEVATMLADRGIKISVSSLKRYLASTKKDKAGATKPRRPRRTAAQKQAEAEVEAAAKSPATAEPAVAPLEQPVEEAAPSTKRTTRRPTSTRAKTSAKATASTSRPPSTRTRKNKA